MEVFAEPVWPTSTSAVQSLRTVCSRGLSAFMLAEHGVMLVHVTCHTCHTCHAMDGCSLSPGQVATGRARCRRHCRQRSRFSALDAEHQSDATVAIVAIGSRFPCTGQMCVERSGRVGCHDNRESRRATIASWPHMLGWPRAEKMNDGRFAESLPSSAKTVALFTGVARYLRTYESYAPWEQSVRNVEDIRGSDFRIKCSLVCGNTST